MTSKEIGQRHFKKKIVAFIWFDLYKEVILSSVIIGIYIPVLYDLAINYNHICVRKRSVSY